MNNSAPFQEKLTNITSAVLVVIILLLLCYWLLVDTINDDYQKEYIKSLNEHDKSVIATYNAQRKLYPRIIKRNKKHDSNNSSNNTNSN